jgi:hypothetical protein
MISESGLAAKHFPIMIKIFSACYKRSRNWLLPYVSVHYSVLRNHSLSLLQFEKELLGKLGCEISDASGYTFEMKGEQAAPEPHKI